MVITYYKHNLNDNDLPQIVFYLSRNTFNRVSEYSSFRIFEVDDLL